MQLLRYHKGSAAKVADLHAESRGIVFCHTTRSLLVARGAGLDSVPLNGKDPEEWLSTPRLDGINALISHGENIFFERDNKVDGFILHCGAHRRH